jgi:hypothetical protein
MTPSSATAERGAVAAWWSEGETYGLRKNMAWSEDVQARVSSYRDTQSRSLQRTLADSFWRKLEATSKNTWHCDILI